MMSELRRIDASGNEVDLPADEQQAEAELISFREDARRIETALAGVVLGQEQAIDQTLMAILAGGHVLLEGVPGIGKTLLVKSAAAALGLSLARVQCTPDLIPADITGTNILVHDEDASRRFRFQPGPIFSSVVLADEINRATPKTQSAFLEAMEEKQVTIAGKSHVLPKPFMLLATQNPIEMEGTFPLPEAQLDRFMFKILISFPVREQLVRIAQATTGTDLPEPAGIIDPDRLIAMQRLVRRIPISSDVLNRAAGIVEATHPEAASAPEEVRRYVRYGASPRGLQAMVLGAKVAAIRNGRYHVSESDLAIALRPALRHRVLLNFEATATSSGIEEVLATLESRMLS
jgi:MoxR-like ATPase